MLIEEGYWNYYMTFQVRSNADIVKSLQALNKKVNSTLYGIKSYTLIHI